MRIANFRHTIVALLAGGLALGVGAKADENPDATLPVTAAEAGTEVAAETFNPVPEFVIEDASALIGQIRYTQSSYEDTLVDIARANGIGYEEIRIANPGVDTWLPGEGTTVRLPTQFVLPQAQRTGIVINIAEYRMYYFVRDGDLMSVQTFPISVGRMDWATPLGRSSIVNKVKNPSWYPPQSVRDEHAADGRTLGTRVPPGPDNPLGEYAMRLSIPGYLIHGTNRPAGVGMRVTHGCIRMFPEHIEGLFPKVPVNTRVEIVNQPNKLGWSGDDLYLEVHPHLESADESAGLSLTSITRLYIDATKDRAANVNWQLIDEVYKAKLGIPVKVGHAVRTVPGVAVEQTASLSAD